MLRFIKYLFAVLVVTSCVSTSGTLPRDVQKNDGFKFVRLFFPADATEDVFARRAAMSGSAKQQSARVLQSTLNAIDRRAANDREGLALLLASRGIDYAPASSETPRITIKDDGQAWAHALSDREIAVAGRTIRGLMLGTLIEVNSSSSMMTMFYPEVMGRPSSTDPAALMVGEIDSEEEYRFKLMLDLFEKAQFQGVMGMIGEMMRDDWDSFDDQPDTVEEMAEAYLGKGKRVPLELGLMLTGAMQNFLVAYKTAEIHLLSHELGHVKLSHVNVDACDILKRQEDEADLFAAAQFAQSVDLTVLLQSGGLLLDSADAESLMALIEEFTPVAHRYVFRHAFTAAGMSGSTGAAECLYRDADDRIAFTDAAIKDFLGMRLVAFEEMSAYIAARPPRSGQFGTSMKLSREDRDALYERLGKVCKGAPYDRKRQRGDDSMSVGGFSDWDDDDTIYYSVECRWPKPERSEFSSRALALIGEPAWQKFVALY